MKETLINAVKERPALYDLRNENFHKKQFKTDLWNEVGAELDIKGNPLNIFSLFLNNLVFLSYHRNTSGSKIRGFEKILFVAKTKEYF
jgi:Alcohol dehydrogenase transcription factor Myb/SANT-like